MNDIDYAKIFRIYSKWDVPEDVILHMLRVAELIRKLSLQIFGSDKDVALLIKAALLHDVGKALVNREILNKPGKLTAQEFEEMKRHVEYTVQILVEEKMDQRVITFVEKHHERSNGSGYPKGVKSLSAYDEILAICDIYDAVTSNRPYRPKLNCLEAKQIIEAKKNGFNRETIKQLFTMIGDDSDFYKVGENVS